MSKLRPSVLLLITAGSLSPFAMTICIPALPFITKSFQNNPEQGQYIVSIFLFGLAIAQPIHGLLADRYGRRPVILIAFSICLVASILCIFAQNMLQLVILRFIQAIGVAAGTVVARAIIRDTSNKQETARLTAMLAGGMGVAPTIAPLISGFLVENLGWQYCFAVIALLTLPVTLLLARYLTETIPSYDIPNTGLKHIKTQISSVVHTVSFWKYTLIFGLSNAAFFSYLTNAPTYFITYMDISPSVFGTFMGLNSIIYFISATMASKLIKYRGMTVTLHIGLAGMGFASSLMLVFSLIESPTIIIILIPFIILFAFAGLVQPAAMAGAVISHPKQAGTAAGLSNSIAMAIGAVSAMLSPQVLNSTLFSFFWPVALGIFLSILSNLLRDNETERLLDEPIVASSYDAETIVVTDKD